MSPSDAGSGRSELFRAYLRGRNAVYGYVLGGGGAFLVGAWQGNPLLMAAGPAAVVAVVLALAWRSADRRAADRFYGSYAAGHGLTWYRRYGLLELTPLLGAGDRRWCEHWMAGTLAGEPGFRGGLGHFVFQQVERDDGRARVTDTKRFTVCAIELEPSLPYFKGLYVRRRRGVFGEGEDWVRHSDSRTIQMESTAFADRYEVRLASDQDELMARRLLSPTLVSWLAAHPLAPCFEAKAGTVVVYVPRPIEDAGNLTFFMDAARHVAGRVLRETEESLARQPA